MSDIDLEFTTVPNRYQDVVQRLAVLNPLRGMTDTVEATRLATAKLQEQWRARVGSLTDNGWCPRDGGRLEQNISFVRNCRPSFAMIDRFLRACRQYTICPFCYARWVRDVWELVDSKFKAPDTRDVALDVPDPLVLRSIMLDTDIEEFQPRTATTFPFHLVERMHTFNKPIIPPALPDITIEENLEVLLQGIEDARKIIVRTVDPVGAFLYTTVEPYGTSEWRIKHRQLFKIAANHEWPANLSGTITRYERPTRKVIMQAVARVCRYPRRLLVGDPTLTVRLLSTKKAVRFRGSARYRGFRGTTYE